MPFLRTFSLARPVRMRAAMSLLSASLLITFGLVSAEAQTPPAVPKRRVAVMVLRPHGFEPSSMEITAGHIIFAVYNRTGLDEIDLRILREAQPVDFLLREERLRPGKRVLGADFELTPGTFIVTEANHPAWKCRVTVKPPIN